MLALPCETVRIFKMFRMTLELASALDRKRVKDGAALGGENGRRTRTKQKIGSEASSARRELDTATQPWPALDSAGTDRQILRGEAPWPRRKSCTRRWMQPLDDHHADSAVLEPESLGFAALRKSDHSA